MIKPDTVTSGKMLNTAVEERSIDVRKTYRECQVATGPAMIWIQENHACETSSIRIA